MSPHYIRGRGQRPEERRKGREGKGVRRAEAANPAA